MVKMGLGDTPEDVERKLIEKLQEKLKKGNLSKRTLLEIRSNLENLLEEKREYVRTNEDQLYVKGEELIPEWGKTLKELKKSEYSETEEGRFLIEIIENKIPDSGYYNFDDIEVEEGDKIVFLLGAGASEPSDIPTVNKMFSVLQDRVEKIQNEEINDLMEWCERQGIEDIEDLLTSIYLSDFAAGSDIAELTRYLLFSQPDEEIGQDLTSDASSITSLQETLQNLFSLLTSTMMGEGIEINEAHEEIRKFIQEYDSDKVTIITTNYDCLMDKELVQNNIDLKQTIGGSGVDDPDDSVDLIKMHGSISWSYCESCQNTTEYNFPKMEKAFLNDTHGGYPIGSICPNCQSQRIPMLVPPISFKFLMFPPLIRMWNSARENINEADYIVSVGYSFSDADSYIQKILSESMDTNEEQKMININPDMEVTVDLENRFDTYVTDFDAEERLIGIHEGSEVAVPKLIDKVLVDMGKRESEEDTKEPTEELPSEKESATD